MYVINVNSVSKRREDYMNTMISSLYNVVIYNPEKEPKVERMQFYAGDINGAIKQAEEHGEVVKITHAAWDNERYLY